MIIMEQVLIYARSNPLSELPLHLHLPHPPRKLTLHQHLFDARPLPFP